jgi:antibiotic biosynthesis monooxygenase (ABM) superfamily enzyme
MEESMKKALLALVAAGFLILTGALAQDATPKTVIHVITVKWKSDASQAQIDRALQTVAALPSKYPGIKHVWTKPIKKQIPEGYSTVIVMEFADESALKEYVDSPAQKSFYDAYMPIREESRTSDISN